MYERGTGRNCAVTAEGRGVEEGFANGRKNSRGERRPGIPVRL
jgi:hypothetical protein